MTIATVLVHGGAGTHALLKLDVNAKEIVERGVVNAARAGFKAMESFQGQPESDSTAALEAVTAAVMSMEDNEMFNAGKGSCLTARGTVEMDASLQNGCLGLKCGAVVGIEGVKNPIRVAKEVMNKTKHVSLVGRHALEFARKNDLELVDPEDLITERSKKRLANCPEYKPALMHYNLKEKSSSETSEQLVKRDSLESSKYGTVGAVAVDSLGNVAYATSTGGITAKMPGRMGDTPVIGSGGYADNNTCAVSTTGDGETIMKTCMAYHISSLVEQGIPLSEAMTKAVEIMHNKTLGGMAGCIGVNSQGDHSVTFNTEAMSWARVTAGHNQAKVHYGIYKEDHFTEDY